MQTPRILAIADIQITSPPDRAEDLIAFYTELVGLDRVADKSDDLRMTFRGYPRRGPWIVVRLDTSAGEANRRRVQIQMASLQECADRLADARIAREELQGWAFYDRRICVLDPAGNLVEFVAYHSF
jgi:hypothetical protein